jgi:CheY-like chemotaxis protein
MKKYKIILVENDEDEQMFMKEGFAESGLFDILAVVRNGDSLFDWMETHSSDLPDLVLSDLNMPGKNGYDIIDEIVGNPEYSSVSVIITSTSTARSIMEKCLSRGASDFLVKPDTFIEYMPFAKKLYEGMERVRGTEQGK